jgi:hypothetical protein
MLCLWAAIARSGSLRVEVPDAAFAAGCSPRRGFVPDEACFEMFGWCDGLVPFACCPACLLVCCWKSSCSA